MLTRSFAFPLETKGVCVIILIDHSHKTRVKEMPFFCKEEKVILS